MSQLDAALDLLRRLPPQNTEKTISDLLAIVPDLTDDLLSSVDQPLQVKTCKKTGRDYLISDFNRDANSYRSPWSNEYDPPLTDGTVPSSKIRKLEVAANDAFDTYREMYYDSGVSSVYLWDLDDGFAGAVLLKKVNDGSQSLQGSWDSIHVFEAQERGRTTHYKLTSTIMLNLLNSSNKLGEMNLSGSMTRQTEADAPVDDTSAHIINMGRMVEDMEIKMRNFLQEVYFGKTKDIVNDLRSSASLTESKKKQRIQLELVAQLSQRPSKFSS